MSVFPPPPTSFPVAAFEKLLPALSDVLKAVNDGGDSDEPQHRIAIANSTNELKRLISEAKALIDSLPGGEMLLQDQDVVIQALQQLKSQKLEHLLTFKTLNVSGVQATGQARNALMTAQEPTS